MRGRSLHATLAAALLVGAPTLVRAQDADLFADVDTPSAAKLVPATTFAATTLGATTLGATTSGATKFVATGASPSSLDTTGWAPEHAQPVGPTLADDKGADPVASKPAVPAPSKDPLDAANPAPTIATAPAEAPLAPLNAAIKAALDKGSASEIRGAHASERRKERAAVVAFYAAHGYAPIWSETEAPVAAVDPVLARLQRAAGDALTTPTPPTRLLTQGTPGAVAASEIALSDAVVAYARQATGSRVDPRAISPLIGARPELADPAAVLTTVAAAGAEAGDRLAAQNPTDPRYVALRDKLATSRGTRATDAPIPPGPTLKIGMHDARVPLLRARFGLVANDLTGDDDTYDVSIAEAVSGVQRTDGLPVTGQLNRRTIAAMAGGSKATPLEAALTANMEMWRWMPRHLGSDRIEVDVPAYTVTVFHDGEPVATNRVVVGKTETPTPLFSNTMKYLIVNPVWNVPDSIIQKEFLPKGGGYMAAHGFAVSTHNGKLVVKQPAGAKNALGRIKFIFPNDYSVYLHDTPSKSLFAASKRAFSHGCVRVDQPFDFAYSVLNDSVQEGGKVLYSEKRLQGMLGDKERYVNLPKPLPIHIEYFTASIDPESGRMIQRDDIYGYAHDVAVVLGLTDGPLQAGEHKPADQKVAERKPRHDVERVATEHVRSARARTAVAEPAPTEPGFPAFPFSEDPR